MPVNQLLGGRYRFVKSLGSHARSNTYLVEDTYLPDHPKCVVKRLPLLGRGQRAMQFILLLLRKKAETLKHVGSHEQIPKILAYFEEDNTFYLVEEFIPGRSLSDIFKAGQPFTETTVVQLLQEVLKILLVLHSWGVIHRCVKPSNIIQRQIDGKLVLTGFGIFKEISLQNGRPGEPMPPSLLHQEAIAYLPPDQLQGQRHFHSDIYAVGMIGIQALTGMSAHELSQIKLPPSSNGSPKRPVHWQQRTNVSPALAAVLEKMTAPIPEQRYQTAAEVLEDIRRLMPDEGIGSSSIPNTSLHMPPDTNPEKVVTPKAPPRWLMPGLIAVLAASILGSLLLRVPQRGLAQHYFQQGLEQEQLGDDQQSIATYTQAIRIFPLSTAYLRRGEIYLRQENWQAAQQDLSTAIELDPSLGEAFYQRGNVRYELGDRKNALADYTKALELNPTIIRAYVNRGSVRAEMGDEEGAIDDYSKAIKQDPRLAAAYLNRCLSQANLEQYQEAIADCNQAIELEASVLSYQNRGLVLRRIGDPKGAIADFNSAIRLDPDDADPYYNRGLARMDVGDIAGAIEDYTRAIELNPEHPFAYYDRATAREVSGDLAGAIADLEQSAKMCLNAGMIGCYEDAQYQRSQIQQSGSIAPLPLTSE